MLTDKIDELYPRESLERYAGLYQKIPEHKRERLSSKLGGHQSKEFYQGMMRYMGAASMALGDKSYFSLAESAMSISCFIAHGLLYEQFGARIKTVSHSLLDDKMDEDALRKAVQTPLPPHVEKEIEKTYGEAQSLQFYEGMFRAAVVVFTTAYNEKKVNSTVLNNLIWNYAFLGRIISKKLSQN